MKDPEKKQPARGWTVPARLLPLTARQVFPNRRARRARAKQATSDIRTFSEAGRRGWLYRVPPQGEGS